MVPRKIGRYRLTRLLGHGSTAEVHCAKDTKSNALVAIKILHEFMTDQQIKQKFMDEAMLVEALDHPGIIHIIDADFYRQTRPYIVMNYAPGGTLRKRHPPGSILPSETVISYTKQLANALAYAHRHKVVHCDVKPENVLLDKDDHLLLSDFGIARIRETTLSQTTGNAFGTATYMAPEQFRGKYSPATDQYALATVVYEWLCGYPPFSGTNQNQLMDRHMNMPVPSLREACQERGVSRNIPLAAEDVLSKALAKDPNARFPSIEEFAQALEQALPPDTILNDAPSCGENVAQSPKSNSSKQSQVQVTPQPAKPNQSPSSYVAAAAIISAAVAAIIAAIITMPAGAAAAALAAVVGLAVSAVVGLAVVSAVAGLVVVSAVGSAAIGLAAVAVVGLATAALASGRGEIAAVAGAVVALASLTSAGGGGVGEVIERVVIVGGVAVGAAAVGIVAVGVVLGVGVVAVGVVAVGVIVGIEAGSVLGLISYLVYYFRNKKR